MSPKPGASSERSCPDQAQVVTVAVMMLEDHWGDVVRKARQAQGVNVETAAQAAAISPADLTRLEEAGSPPGSANLERWAATIGLHSQKLLGLIEGWRPEQPDLGLWRELRVISTAQNGINVNCYLVWDEVSREAALFDTGWDAEPIRQLIQENGLQLKHLFLTHGHDDHMAALGGLREHFPKMHLHTGSKHAPPQHRNRANDFIHLGSLRITNRETPGHAEDSVIYIVGNWAEDAPHAAMIGDTLFAGSLATGLQSTELLKQKVREQIFSLPLETLLCPGHGPLTTIAQEKAHNPFF